MIELWRKREWERFFRSSRDLSNLTQFLLIWERKNQKRFPGELDSLIGVVGLCSQLSLLVLVKISRSDSVSENPCSVSQIFLKKAQPVSFPLLHLRDLSPHPTDGCLILWLGQSGYFSSDWLSHTLSRSQTIKGSLVGKKHVNLFWIYVAQSTPLSVVIVIFSYYILLPKVNTILVLYILSPSVNGPDL